jgi:hypothetical protein
MVTYRCPIHDVVLVGRELPFQHFACPVAGCATMKPNKWAPRVSKKELNMPKNSGKTLYAPMCVQCGNTILALMPVHAPESPFDRVYCPDCHTVYNVTDVARKKL